MITEIVLAFLACIFWFIIFSPWTKSLFNFWLAISVASAILAVLALIIDRKNIRRLYCFKPSHMITGLASAIALYMVFFVGRIVAEWLLPFAADQIESIYFPRQHLSSLTVALLLFFLIGPAEEIFWRGFIQQRCTLRFGNFKGWILAASLYSLVHIFSFNFILISTAFLCGLFWGFLFKKFNSVWPVIISHAVWDVIIFVVLPIQ